MRTILICIIIICCCSPQIASAQGAEEHFNQGNSFFEGERYDQAEQAYKRAIAIDPEYTEAYVALALLYTAKEDHDAAAVWYEKALELKLNHKGLYGLGMIHLSKKDYDAAIAYFEKAVERKPDYAAAYRMLGDTYVAKKDVDKAIESYKSAVAIQPNHITNYRLGLLYADLKDYPTAIKYYQQALVYDARHAETYLWLGQAYYQTGKVGSALRQVDTLWELNQGDLAIGLHRWINDKEAKKPTGSLKRKRR
jgi:tetratricopeptide (TPR) repeat protein